MKYEPRQISDVCMKALDRYFLRVAQISQNYQIDILSDTSFQISFCNINIMANVLQSICTKILNCSLEDIFKTYGKKLEICIENQEGGDGLFDTIHNIQSMDNKEQHCFQEINSPVSND